MRPDPTQQNRPCCSFAGAWPPHEVTGIGQDELAATIGQSPRSIALWLTGVRLPSAVSLKALSRTFGVPADWLLGADAVEIASGLTRLAEIASAPKIAGADKASD